MFKSFGREPVEGDDGIALIFQCGLTDFTGEEMFFLDFVRQFAEYENEEYYSLEQLHFEFIFTPTEELTTLKAEEWYFDYEGDVEEYYTKIEGLEQFKIPVEKEPIAFNIYQEKI